MYIQNFIFQTEIILGIRFRCRKFSNPLLAVYSVCPALLCWCKRAIQLAQWATRTSVALQNPHHRQNCWAPCDCEPGEHRPIATGGVCFNSPLKRWVHPLAVRSRAWGKPQGWCTCCQAFASPLRDDEWGEPAGGLIWKNKYPHFTRDKTTVFTSYLTPVPGYVSTMPFPSSSLFLPIFTNKIVPNFPP